MFVFLVCIRGEINIKFIQNHDSFHFIIPFWYVTSEAGKLKLKKSYQRHEAKAKFWWQTTRQKKKNPKMITQGYKFVENKH